MAKKAANKKQKHIEETLWESAIRLRGSVEPSEYKHVVLSLIFLKFASERFDHRRQELIAEGKQKYIDMETFYAMKNTFYLPEECRWSYINDNAKQPNIAILIDTALSTIEKINKALKGALPDNYFSRLQLDNSKLASLIDTINNIHTLRDHEQDVVGRVYEYFLKKFAIAEGKGKGEFYTPKCIVNLIAEMIEPYKGIIYDPCCGSGGMFVQSIAFVKSHQGTNKNISVYGQEKTSTTYKLAKMNLAIRGIAANLGEFAADTFFNDQHQDLKADFIMANPPFNLKDWRGPDELIDDPRWAGYEVPPAANANYAWILHMVSKLSENGVAGFLLANGALSGDNTEKQIRSKLIENDLVEAIVVLPRNMFYATDISVTLWIVNKNKNARTAKLNGQTKTYRDRTNQILFMDLRRWGSEFEKKYIELTSEDIQKITSVYHNWQQPSFETEYKNVPEFCYSATLKEIRASDYSLVPSKYIEFVDRDSNIDFKKEMKRIQREFKGILSEEIESQSELIDAFKGLGYEIKL